MSLKKLGRYDIVRVLGKGAMGLVYEALDPNLDRRVAIKTIKVENLSQEAAVEYEARFKTEARSAARLQHPNIVSVYDSDRHDDMAYLVMEFIQGEDLKHHLDSGKLYSLEQSLGMVRELLSALAYAHRQNIVHRDVKPANLLIEASGRVKLTDFGVARIQDSGEATRTQGTMVGTLKYMSPEQVQGLPVDARSDLFAAGIVLYQLLTGKRPFDGDTDFSIIQQIVSHSPVAPSAINALLPPAIDAVVSRALAKKRDLRFASAEEFAQALQQASNQVSDPTIVPPVSQPGRPGGMATDTGIAQSRVGGSTIKMRTSGTDSGSTVTQELELVYWKDIKDTDDLEDLEGFLDKFPSGIYADLARRRVKKLTGNGVSEASLTNSMTITGTLPVSREPESQWSRLQAQNGMEPTLVMPRAAEAPAADDPDATRMVANAAPAAAPSAAPAAPAVAAVSPPGAKLTDAAPAVSAEPAPAKATSEVPSPPPAGRSKMPVLALAGVALLVVAGIAFKLLSGAPAPVANVATPDAPGAVTATPAMTSPVALPAESSAAKPAGPVATAPAVPPVAPASRPAAKRVAAALEKMQQSRASSDKPAAREAAATATVEPRPAAPAGSPRQACEDRILLGFQVCMNEQCAKPAFTNHPICAERRAMQQQRQEAQERRN
ncbi:MAG TPA: protein kinase [Polaromonas sp.]|uniref:serine/threonine-protein kinase n=1 Tax=Polaromonas sp. TaxID=1869339 RepID=UPI002D36C3EF|nr:protein kinase [Polaromonas sp.]HYW58560.1 protein kinase [Polaromonas sp.]